MKTGFNALEAPHIGSLRSCSRLNAFPKEVLFPFAYFAYFAVKKFCLSSLVVKAIAGPGGRGLLSCLSLIILPWRVLSFFAYFAVPSELRFFLGVFSPSPQTLAALSRQFGRFFAYFAGSTLLPFIFGGGRLTVFLSQFSGDMI